MKTRRRFQGRPVILPAGRRGVRSLVVRILLGSALLGAGLGTGATSPAAAPAAVSADDVYQHAGQCVALRDTLTGGYVVRSRSRYSMRNRARGATPFRMQATGLGRYLLYGPDGRMPAAGRFGRIVSARRPGPRADWVLEDAGEALRLTSLSTGRDLSINRRGLLTQSRSPDPRWSLALADDCASFPEIEIHVEGEPFSGPGPGPGVQGFADAHVHVTAFEFLGGRFHCGRPWSPYGVAEALEDCPDHGKKGRFAIAENLLSNGSLTGMHTSKGWPDFGSPELPGWPRYDSLTHEGTYWKGIERAWRAGLRLLVADLVENRALCELYWLEKNPCTDMASVRLQARALFELQDYIDAQFKGPGKGFFRIVKSPAEARAVIEEGKLAVIIGVETSQPFDCLYQDGVEICTPEQIEQGLQEWWDLGVRSFFPVHKFDNAFGGTAMDSGTTSVLVNLGNKYMTGRWWEVEPCPEGEHDRTPLSLAPGAPEAFMELAGTDPAQSVFRPELTAPLQQGGLPSYPPGPVCNVRGLTALGEHLVHRMIDMGFIIETDHFSVRARERALEIAEERGYSGVVTSHSWGDATSTARIQTLGGFVAPYANTTREFVQEWQEARSTLSGEYLWGIGYGTDTNGLGVQAEPRPGALTDHPVTYPFVSVDGSVTVHQSRWGTRLWDFNLDGASHYGLFADWVEDLQHVAGGEIADDLALGAEAYLRMWERASAGPAGSAGP